MQPLRDVCLRAALSHERAHLEQKAKLCRQRGDQIDRVELPASRSFHKRKAFLISCTQSASHRSNTLSSKVRTPQRRSFFCPDLCAIQRKLFDFLFDDGQIIRHPGDEQTQGFLADRDLASMHHIRDDASLFPWIDPSQQITSHACISCFTAFFADRAFRFHIHDQRGALIGRLDVVQQRRKIMALVSLALRKAAFRMTTTLWGAKNGRVITSSR